MVEPDIICKNIFCGALGTCPWWHCAQCSRNTAAPGSFSGSASSFRLSNSETLLSACDAGAVSGADAGGASPAMAAAAMQIQANQAYRRCFLLTLPPANGFRYGYNAVGSSSKPRSVVKNAAPTAPSTTR